jgi:uncharacterized OsmC-like protein
MATVRTTARYLDTLACTASHPDSGVELRTAAPLDNQGDGSSFSPTDLVGIAVGTCMLTTMAIVAEREGLPTAGLAVETEKHMVADPTRRIGKLVCHIVLPAGLDEQQAARLQRAAQACPVKRSLHPETVVELHFTPAG